MHIYILKIQCEWNVLHIYLSGLLCSGVSVAHRSHIVNGGS
jgi:hypothetical protein